MICLTILATLALCAVIGILIFAGGFMLVFGDVIIAVLVIAAIVGLIRWIGSKITGKKSSPEKED